MEPRCSFREIGTKRREILILSHRTFHSEAGEMLNTNVNVLLWLAGLTRNTTIDQKKKKLFHDDNAITEK